MNLGFKIVIKNTGVSLLLLLFILPVTSFIPNQSVKPGFSFLTQDSVQVDVFNYFDNDSVLNGYKALVYTPICEKEDCYAVDLVFYWDVLGNFEKFELVPGRPLTKKEHEPFTKEDYQKLQFLLKKKHVSFSELKKEDLIQVSEDSIDGYTGATISAVKDEVIDGAVYSCYTLWHIANGAVKDSIHKSTARQLDKKLVQKLVFSDDVEANYFLINHFRTKDFRSYSDEVLTMLRKNSGYFSKIAIEKFPVELISSRSFQDSLSSFFQGQDYFTKLSFLKSLDNQLKSTKLSGSILESIHSGNFSRIELVVELFFKSAEYIDYSMYKALLNVLSEKELKLKKEHYKMIRTLGQTNDQFKKEFKRFKRTYLNTSKT